MMMMMLNCVLYNWNNKINPTMTTTPEAAIQQQLKFTAFAVNSVAIGHS